MPTCILLDENGVPKAIKTYTDQPYEKEGFSTITESDPDFAAKRAEFEAAQQ